MSSPGFISGGKIDSGACEEKDMSKELIEVLVPTAIPVNQQVANAPRANDLKGKVIGLVDNGKPNYDIFLTRLEELLRQRFDFGGIIRIRKGEGETGKALAEADINKLVTGCRAVINGICD
jgi:hypothetical protein